MKLNGIFSFFKKGNKRQTPDIDTNTPNWAEKIRTEIKEGKISGFFIYAGEDSDHPIDFQELKKG